VDVPQELLAHAKKLLQSSGNHLEYRTVIDRAYYSAYHAATRLEEAFPRRSTAKTNTGSHDSLLQRLERPHADLDYGLRIISQDIGAQLRQFKALRELATYDYDQPVSVDQAEQAILAAEDILKECSRGQAKLKSGAK
jgi:uncharacterized protein (UPF0332 family)